MNVDFFLDRVFLTVFERFRTHVLATAVCTTGGVHTLTCCTHIFLRTARSPRTSHTSHACHIHAWLKDAKKVLCTCVTCLHRAFSLLMSHPSFAVPVRRSLSLSRLSCPHVLAVLTCPNSAGPAHLRTRTRSLAIWPSPPSIPHGCVRTNTVLVFGAANRPEAREDLLFTIYDTNWKSAEEYLDTVSRLIQEDIDAKFVQEFHGDITQAKEHWPTGVAVGRLSVARSDQRDPRLCLDSTIPNVLIERKSCNPCVEDMVSAKVVARLSGRSRSNHRRQQGTQKTSHPRRRRHTLPLHSVSLWGAIQCSMVEPHGSSACTPLPPVPSHSTWWMAVCRRCPLWFRSDNGTAHGNMHLHLLGCPISWNKIAL